MMADSVFQFLKADELSLIPEHVRLKIVDHLRDLQAQQGTLEPVENVRRKFSQADNLVRTLRRDADKYEKLAGSLEVQLNAANEDKERLQSEICVLKEQNASVTVKESDMVQKLERWKNEKLDLFSYVIRCQKDEKRYQANIKELQKDKQELQTNKVAMETQYRMLQHELHQARQSVARADKARLKMQKQSESEVSRMNQMESEFQALTSKHAENMTASSQQIETYKQQAEVSERDLAQVTEQARVLQEHYMAALQRKEEIAKTSAETFDAMKKNTDSLSDELRASHEALTEKEREIGLMKMTLEKLEQSLADSEHDDKIDFGRFGAVQRDYELKLKSLQIQLADSEARAEMAVESCAAMKQKNTYLNATYDEASSDVENNITVIGGPKLNRSTVQPDSNLSDVLRNYMRKCNELRVARQENDTLHEQIRTISDHAGDEWSAEERRDLIALLDSKQVLKRITDELTDRCEQLDVANGQLYARVNAGTSALADREKSLAKANFKISCLSQQVRFLVACVEKLHGNDVSFDDSALNNSADDGDDDAASLTSDQRAHITALQPAYAGADKAARGGEQDALDIIRRHFVKFSDLKQLQINNLKLMEALYQLEANDVLRGGNVSDLKQQLEQLSATCALQASRFDEVSKQCAMVMQEREAYRCLCEPTILAVMQPLLANDASIASLTSILTSPKLLDVFEQLNKIQRTLKRFEIEREAQDNVIQSSKEQVGQLQQWFESERERWQRLLDETNTEYRKERSAALHNATQVTALEMARAADAAAARTSESRIKELEERLSTARDEALDLHAQITQSRAAAQSADFTISKYKHEVALLKQELDVARQLEAENAERIAAYEQQLQSLVSVTEQLDTVRAEKDEAAEAYRMAKSRVETLDVTVKELSERINELEKRNDALKLQLSTEVNAQQNIVSARTAELQSVEHRLLAVQAELEKVRKLYEALLVEHNLDIDIHQEHEDLRNSMEYRRDLAEQLTARVTELAARLDEKTMELASEREERKREVDDLNARLQHVQTGSQSSRSQMVKMQADLRQRSATVNTLNKTIEELKSQVGMLTTQLQNIQQELQHTQQELINQQAMSAELQTHIGELSAMNDESRQLLDQATDQLQSVTQIKTALSADFEAAQSSWIEREAEYVVANDKLRQQLNEMRREH